MFKSEIRSYYCSCLCVGPRANHVISISMTKKVFPHVCKINPIPITLLLLVSCGINECTGYRSTDAHTHARASNAWSMCGQLANCWVTDVKHAPGELNIIPKMYLFCINIYMVHKITWDKVPRSSLLFQIILVVQTGQGYALWIIS